MPESAVAAEPTGLRFRRTPDRIERAPGQFLAGGTEWSLTQWTADMRFRPGSPRNGPRLACNTSFWVDENGDSTFVSDEYVAGPWLDQQTNNGRWQSFGVHILRGRVRIEVRARRTRDDYRDIGTVNARLTVDAIRLRKVHR